ncbi:DUF2723 domain-containing protein [Oscillatoria laete-virens NRMC-F 0139]|nr:DUF2723 domain-containing protein [Oscillatoria laete-virens NRMC-F 0139]
MGFLVSFGVYTFTLAPSVVLRDSGELITAAHHLGVPHPPGYPLLTLLSYLFIHIIPFGNVAWKVNWLNALCSSLAVGVISYLICVSGQVLTVNLISNLNEQKRLLYSRAIGFCSLSAGLILSLGHAMWSQSVVAEKYALNSFLMSLILLFLYKWFQQPQNYKHIAWAAFFFGLGMTAHQTLLFIFPAVVFAVFFKTTSFIPDAHALYKSRAEIGGWTGVFTGVFKKFFHCAFLQDCFFKSFFIFSTLLINTSFAVFAILSRDLQLLDICLRWHLISIPILIILCLSKKPQAAEYLIFSGILGISFLIVLYGIVILQSPDLARLSGPMDISKLVDETISGKIFCLSLISLMTGIGSAAFFFMHERGSRFIPLLLIASWAGLIFYGYIHLASKTNPPMNWGYASTAQGFYHAINRGQYENNLANTIKSVLGPAFFVRSVLDQGPQKNLGQSVYDTGMAVTALAKKIKLYFYDLLQNFTVYVCAISLLVFLYIRKIPRASWSWIFFLFVSFLFLSVALTYMVGGDLDRQARWINRVFFYSQPDYFFFCRGLRADVWVLLSFQPELVISALFAPAADHSCRFQQAIPAKQIQLGALRAAQSRFWVAIRV